ncbi:MAG TPA: DUF4153 domain-containing protein [Bacteroidia bacterium]
MKKTDWVLATATLTYSYLFYSQLAGVNFLVFSIVTTLALLLLNKDTWKNKMWILSATLAISTSFFIMWHNSNLAIWANLCSLLLLSGYSIDKNSSVLLNGFYSIYSIGGSYVFIILNSVKRFSHKESSDKPASKSGLKFLFTSIAIILVLIFFFIYKSANPLFEKFTEKINLDFISGAWILFTIAGFFIMYGLLKPQRISMLDKWENNLPVNLIDKGLGTKSFEKAAGVFLFVMLNIMLVFINILDVMYLYILNQLPEGITHTQFVHNGVGMIILSIILGIGIILFLFRNALNFEKNNKIIKVLVTLWILQNAMMIISTSVRNYIYVDEFNLTYKRIGVFVYLILAIIGLILTLNKILSKKSNWYLIRTNAFCCFLFLCLSSFINWDSVICEFNISRKADKLQKLDKKYLLSLSDQTIPYLQSLKNQKGFDTDSAKKDIYRTEGEISSILGPEFSNDYYIKNSDETDVKTYNFLKKIAEYPGWQSWNRRNAYVLEQLNLLNSSGKIETLHLKNQELDSLQLLNVFSNAKEVNLSGASGNRFEFLSSFKNINSLNVSFAKIKKLSELPALPSLKELNMDNNQLQDLSELSRFSNVENLALSNNSMTTLNSIPLSLSVSSLELNNCNLLTDFSALNRLNNLKTLSINNASLFDRFPKLTSLKHLSLDSQTSVCDQNLSMIPVLENLESLSLEKNEHMLLANLLIYNPQTKTYSLRFPNLKRLVLKDNLLEMAGNLAEYKQLQALDLENNHLKNTDFLENYENLRELNLYNNTLTKISFNEKHSGLKILNLNYNQSIDDYNSLKLLPNLEELYLANGRINNLSMLKCEKSLKKLNIANCRINSLNGIERCSSLEELTYSGLKDADIERLKKLGNLKELSLYNSAQLTKEQKEKLKKELPKVKINLL